MFLACEGDGYVFLSDLQVGGALTSLTSDSTAFSQGKNHFALSYGRSSSRYMSSRPDRSYEVDTVLQAHCPFGCLGQVNY